MKGWFRVWCVYSDLTNLCVNLMTTYLVSPSRMDLRSPISRNCGGLTNVFLLGFAGEQERIMPSLDGGYYRFFGVFITPDYPFLSGEETEPLAIVLKLNVAKKGNAVRVQRAHN